MTDAAIRDQVLIHLTTDAEVKGGELQVDVKDGVVTLSGTVDEKKRKDKATKVAKKVKGVKKVVNNIVIKEKGAVK